MTFNRAEMHYCQFLLEIVKVFPFRPKQAKTSGCWGIFPHNKSTSPN